MDLREGTDDDASQHWYYNHKYRVVSAMLSKHECNPNSVKDVGSGSGFFALKFAARWPLANVVAVDKFYETDQLGSRSGVEFVRSLDETQSADFYSLMDVLEHVEDDALMLKTCVEEAKSGAWVLITVPAFNLLWSPHDVFLGHFRRYRLRQVEKLALGAGLELIESRYIFAPLFVPALAVRIAKRIMRRQPRSDMKSAGSLLTLFFTFVLKLDLIPIKNRVAGLSVLVLARKNTNGN